MEIIDFPGKKPKRVKCHENRLQLGPMRFTCDCGTISELHFTGLIFKFIEFFCSSCGTNYKVTNPAFNRPILSKQPSRK